MFNRQYYIAFGLVLLIALVLLNLSEQSAGRLKLAIGGIFLPLFGIAASAGQLNEVVASTFTPRSRLVREIERLRLENQQLQSRLAQAHDALRENAQLRQAVGWKSRAPQQSKLVRVISQDPSDWWRSVLIDSGSRDGLRTNLTVLTPEGLAGRVSEVGFDRSRVLLVGDPDCRVTAQVIQPSDLKVVAKGVVIPSPSSLDRLLVELTFVPGGSLLKPGQPVVTSGDGGTFPKGVLIGQIVDVRTNELGPYIEARVKLAVNLNQLEMVFVMMP